MAETTGLTREQVRANAERINDERLRDRVVAGIAALNQAVEEGRLDAGWPDRIDPRTLLLSSARSCVLGQVFQDEEPTADEWDRYIQEVHGGDPALVGHDPYSRGLAILDGDVMKFPFEFGFDTGPQDFVGYGVLTEAWLVALDDKRDDA